MRGFLLTIVTFNVMALRTPLRALNAIYLLGTSLACTTSLDFQGELLTDLSYVTA
jgi:hypothetical protein